MKTLYLMRHGKAPGSPTGDEGRELDETGREEARIMAAWMRDQNMIPDKILCSTATRTRQTLAEIELVWKNIPLVDFKQSLYMANVDTITDIVQNASAEKIMIIGHNPTLPEFIARMVEEITPDQQRQMLQGFPTASLGVLEFDLQKWQNIVPHTATLKTLVWPALVGGSK